MVSKVKKHECKSYWKKDGLYDLSRIKETKVKIFGVTIWMNSESYNCDMIDDNKNEIGFKK